MATRKAKTENGIDKKTTYSSDTFDVNPVVGGVIGAVAGAAIGTMTAAALKDTRTRKKVFAQFESLKKQAIQTLKEIKDDDDIREKVRKHFE